MRHFLNMLRQDLTLAYRNGFLVVILALAVVMVTVINYGIPAEVKVGASEYVVDLTDGKLIESALAEQLNQEFFLASEAQGREMAESKSNAVVLIFRGSQENPQVTILHQGNEPPKAISALEPALFVVWNQAAELGFEPVHEKVVLRPETPKPPFNKSLVPLLMGLEVAVLGFAFVAVLIFQEKAEGSVRAYRVSPRGAWPYIWSKTLSMVLLSVLYAALIAVPTLGLGVNYLPFFALIVLVSLLMTMCGLFLTVFFESLSEFVFPLVGIVTLLALPMVSYFFPSFRLPGFELIPVYPLMFGLREIVFPTGKTGFLAPMVGILLAEILVIAVLSKWAVSKRLMKEGR